MTEYHQQNHALDPWADETQPTNDKPLTGTITLPLRERIVTFTGQQVSSIPDPFSPNPKQDQLVYLTAKGNVAVYDPNRLTLTVRELDDFIDTYMSTPVSWIVEDVLAAVARPIEALDI